jgi:hypothetical protein
MNGRSLELVVKVRCDGEEGGARVAHADQKVCQTIELSESCFTSKTILLVGFDSGALAAGKQGREASRPALPRVGSSVR